MLRSYENAHARESRRIHCRVRCRVSGLTVRPGVKVGLSRSRILTGTSLSTVPRPSAPSPSPGLAVRTPDEVVAYCSWTSNYYTTVNRSCLDRFGYNSRAAPEVPLALLSAAGPGCSFTSSGIRLLSTSFA